MKWWLGLITAFLCMVILGYFLLPRTAQPPVIPTLQTSNTTRTVDTPYGFSYAYRDGDDGYALYTPKDAGAGPLVSTQLLLQHSDIPPESTAYIDGVVWLTINVFRNTEELETREWITKTEASHYKLSADGTISGKDIHGAPFLTYQFDGLYRADAYVYGNGGYIYMFTNMWDNPESAQKKDMEKVVESIRLMTPSYPAESVHGDISVSVPEVGASIATPLKVEGRARGTWFFEGTFPITLKDADGAIIAAGYAEAQGDWMTSSFVPFTAELAFKMPVSLMYGVLILERNNASGLPEHEASIEVPIIFN